MGLLGGLFSEQESWVSPRNLVEVEEQEHGIKTNIVVDDDDDAGYHQYQDSDELWFKMHKNSSKSSKSNSNCNGNCSRSGSLKRTESRKKSQVLLEGYVEGAANDNEDDLNRTKSLTDEDLDELKGCLDLGFGFSYDEIPELCNTLPALELCYSMSQKFLLDDNHKSPERSSPAPTDQPACSPIANWKISSPGDHPEDVKARLKFWAQTVACTVRLCS